MFTLQIILLGEGTPHFYELDVKGVRIIVKSNDRHLKIEFKFKKA